MKKRVFSALLVLCMACSLVSTVWASPSTPETATPETAAPASPTPSPTPDVSAYPARAVEQTVEGSGVTVQVDIPAGSLPADARLTAELLGASTDADAADTVADVAAELDEADVDYDGFVALDISFVDAAGAKIEPLQPVSVSFSLPADLLPAEADPATLAVQHLAEDETGEVETVETVADVADETAGTVTVETGAAALSLEEDAAALPADAEVKAEFEVDGFSAMVLTWNTAETAEAAAYSAGGVETRAAADQNGQSTYTFTWQHTRWNEGWKTVETSVDVKIYNSATGSLLPIDIPNREFNLGGVYCSNTLNGGDGEELSFAEADVPEIDGYEYVGATYTFATNLVNHPMKIGALRVQDEWGIASYSWYYTIDGEVAVWQDLEAHHQINQDIITVRLNYVPVEAQGDFYIKDDVDNTGRFVATFADEAAFRTANGISANDTLVYTWSRSINGEDWDVVQRQNASGSLYNLMQTTVQQAQMQLMFRLTARSLS